VKKVVFEVFASFYEKTLILKTLIGILFTELVLGIHFRELVQAFWYPPRLGTTGTSVPPVILEIVQTAAVKECTFFRGFFSCIQ
jgi:hypothetical protein